MRVPSLPLSSPCGISRQPISATKVNPTTAATMPTGAKSNIANGVPSRSSRMVAMMMLGGVPISVAMPPRMVAKDSGISDRPGLRPALRAVWMSTGISSASAATLFIKADKTAPTLPMIAICAPSLRPVATSVRVIRNTAPDRTSPADTISTSATTSVAGWPNPAKASLVGTAPRTTATISAPNATISYLIRPHSSRANTTAKRLNRIY